MPANPTMSTLPPKTHLQNSIAKRVVVVLQLSILMVLVTSADLFAQTTEQRTTQQTSIDQWWDSFRPLSEKAFEGRLVHAPEGDTTFADKTLVIYVREANEDRIAIHFFVGDDRSRTWLLTRQDGHVLLKHDHRHQDGTEDDVTQYGGRSTNTGSSNRQVFPADQETTTMLPAAASNVWWIDVEEGEHYTYNMRRLGTDRYFSVRFDLTNEVAQPPAAWGWDQ